jgi:hypothetical protein
MRDEMEHEYTFLRFEVELNLPGFPDDDGDAVSEKVRLALLSVVRGFDADATVVETTD